MEQNEVELLVDKKVAEAKLEIAEKRNQFLLWFFGIMLTIVGVGIPLVQSNRSTDKVDQAILDSRREAKEIRETYEKKAKEIEGDFQTKVKEVSAQQKESLSIISANADKTVRETKEQVQTIIGQQLAKPELVCLYKGETLEGKTITVDDASFLNKSLALFNKGDAPARNVTAILYLSGNTSMYIISGGVWNEREISEEKEFKKSYSYFGYIEIIDAKYSNPLNLELALEEGAKNAKEEAMLKIFYGQPEPTKVNFTIKLNKK
ncbi:MAG: hypothetical protein FD122_72 [Stygiobacter sp.]|nr:MAG: hypothetical protein FD122_72 [Stygiobacter sp.]KAF0217168.1 MAG: hypothetical protein FD178_704 [Ignavibacteria bacterium]